MKMMLTENTNTNYWIYALIAFGVLLAIGVILAIGLIVAEKFFHVEEDPRIKAVEEMLPKANCGNCGYPGCHELAEAIVKGEVKKCSTCKVGNPDKNFKPIIEYLSEHPDADGTKHIPKL